MKQLEVRVRTGGVADVVRLAERHRAFDTVHHPVTIEGEGGDWHRVLINVPNDEVGPFVAAVGEAVEADFVVPTVSSLPVSTPIEDVRDRVEDVSSRSTLELVLAVLQSVGSWQGMLLYAVVSGLVAAYGVIFNLSFLLTAAMLIAPMGAPVMVCVVAVALGDLWMLRRGGIRFLVSILVLAVAAAALGLAYGLSAPTEMMETLTSLSVWSALLGVMGGAAGAQALIQSERDSMVTATATGFLVAVSLSPPSAVVGLAAALGRWDHVLLMTFLIALTFVGILLGGWVALRYQGVRPERPSAERGSGRRVVALVAAGVLLLGGMIGWQSRAGPGFAKADRVRSATQLVERAVADVGSYRLLAVSARFTPGPSEWHEGEGLLLSVVVARNQGVRSDTVGTGGRSGRVPDPARSSDPDGSAEPAGAERALRSAIRDRLRSEMVGVRPFVDLTVLP